MGLARHVVLVNAQQLLPHDVRQFSQRGKTLLTVVFCRLTPPIPFRNTAQIGIGVRYRIQEQIGMEGVRIFLLCAFSLWFAYLMRGL